MQNVPLSSNGSPGRVQEGSFRVVLLGQCNLLVKKCFGWKQLLKIKCGERFIIPSAPHDLVILSCMHRPYYPNGERRSRPSNVYFHCNLQCIYIHTPPPPYQFEPTSYILQYITYLYITRLFLDIPHFLP